MRLGVSAVQHDMKREETVEEAEKNTEWQRRTPKRGVGGSNPLWDARKHRCKPFFGVCSVFLFLLLPVISLLLPGDFYTPHDVYLGAVKIYAQIYLQAPAE